MNTHVVADLIGNVVARTESAILPYLIGREPLIQALSYQHGHPLEVVQMLSQKDESTTYRSKRFPVIALFHDFKEIMNPRPGVYATVTLNIIIANETKPEYVADDRYDVNFRPFLYPIYDEFVKQLRRSGYFIIGGNGPSHEKIDRLYWGKTNTYANTDGVSNDYLDCIEINNLKLDVNEKICNICLP